MYEPPAQDAGPQWPQPPDREDPTTAHWPVPQAWPGSAPNQEGAETEDGAAGRGQLSGQFWRRSEAGRNAPAQPAADASPIGNVVALPGQHVPVPPYPSQPAAAADGGEPPRASDAPGQRPPANWSPANGSPSGLSPGDRQPPAGSRPVPATAEALGLGEPAAAGPRGKATADRTPGDSTGTFPRWGTGLVPPLGRPETGDDATGQFPVVPSVPAPREHAGADVVPEQPRATGSQDVSDGWPAGTRFPSPGLRAAPFAGSEPASPDAVASGATSTEPVATGRAAPELPAPKLPAPKLPAPEPFVPGSRGPESPGVRSPGRKSRGPESRGPESPGPERTGQESARPQAAAPEPRAADPLTGPLPPEADQDGSGDGRRGSARLAANLRSGSPPHWLEMLRAEAQAGLAQQTTEQSDEETSQQETSHEETSEQTREHTAAQVAERHREPAVPAQSRSSEPTPGDPPSHPESERPSGPPSADARRAERWSRAGQQADSVRRDAPVATSGRAASGESSPGPGGSDESADAAAVLTAVRELPGVRGAELLGEPGRQQVLRLDLVASVDPNVVGRRAAALLRDQLGVHAAVRARGHEPALAPRYVSDPRRLAEDAPASDPPSGGRRRDRTKPPDQAGTGTTLLVSVEQVQVVTAGLEAAVEVGLAVAGVRVAGRAAGPAHDWHVLRAAVTATTEALGMLVAGRARLALEYADLVQAGPARIAVVSLLLVSARGTERVAGAAPVNGEPPDAAVSATIAAVHHRLSDLLDETVLAG